jgi:hypothetical protein
MDLNKNDFKIGFTTLGYLSISPKYFISKQKDLMYPNEEEKSYFILGGAVHCKLLRPDDYEKEYYCSTITPPTGKKTLAVDYIFNNRKRAIDEFAKDIILQEAFDFAELKGAFLTLKNDILTTPAYVHYYASLVNSEGKKILSPQDDFIVKNCVDSIKRNVACSDLLGLSPLNNKISFDIVHTEKELLWKYKEYTYELSSTPDRFIIDHINKKIIVLDIKTTSKSPYSFEYSYKTYGYYRQAAIYNEAIKASYSYPDYSFENYLLVVGTIGFESVVYKVSEEDLILGLKEFEDQIALYDYHYKTNNWEYPKNIIENNGILTLKISESESSEK